MCAKRMRVGVVGQNKTGFLEKIDEMLRTSSLVRRK
jgi:hypothetical protein